MRSLHHTTRFDAEHDLPVPHSSDLPTGARLSIGGLHFTTAAAGPVPPAPQPDRENVASSAAGATVIGTSTDFGSGDNDSGFCASNAADGKSNIEWSSHGDGDDAGIEIEMDRTYDEHTIGFWTRAVSDDTAQIFTFSVTTDTGETLGPSELADSGHTCYFPMEFTARTPRVDAPTTNPGNTGAMEIQVYGAPHGE